MSDPIYRRLAERLDAIPNGFPATASGVELELLARMFTLEEAVLAAVMRLGTEPAPAIAERAGFDLDVAERTLKAMVRKGLIRARRKDGQLVFGLMPFVVGIYEEQLPRMDAELAALFERYFVESQGGVAMATAPAVHRVIPIEETVPFDLEIMPYERASELLERAQSWGVRDCICRVQQKLVGKGCDRPVENCLILAPVEGAFDHSETTRAITKEEAFHILHEAEEAGLVHSTANYQDGHFYICNCCTCCCAVLRAVVEFGAYAALARSDFCAVVDVEACVGCGTCIDRCQFGALEVPDDVCVVDAARCVGCGLCAIACPAHALHLVRLEEGQADPPPADLKDWMMRRAEAREISIFDIL